ncbi:MAG: hypothetical protein A2293_09560 [Elusimicrobia bacterium RIFOXYB2_FULL_49_7]|nr:MAG: hypothetical protein A2293_09560 [Elusimicrobia bacterium RIFOXYB2_FULL_49_7]
MNFLRKHMKVIFLITIIGFLAGAFVGFGSYLFGKKTATDAVAEVNGKEISYRRFAVLLNRAVENASKEQQGTMSEEMIQQKKQEVLQDLIQEEVFWQEALKYGISVPDKELAMDIQNYPAFQKDGRFDQGAYFQVLYQVLRTTPQEFEDSRRKQIAIYKLRHLIASGVRISEAELRLEYARANRGNMKDFEKNKTEFSDKLRQEKVMMVFNEWFKQLNQTVKIEVFLNEIEQQGRG